MRPILTVVADDRYRDQIVAQMTAAGIETPPDQIVADGRLHRFASTPGRHTGWYIIHPDPVAPAWSFGDWRLGIKERHEGDPGRVLDAAEIAECRERLREMRARIAAEEARFQAGAAIEAKQRWDRCLPAPAEHGYLRAKQIDVCGARIDGENLLVPMRDIDGKLWSLQEIDPEGRKHNQEGGRRKGCFFLIGGATGGGPEADDTLCIAEGFSTAASIHMATGHAVAAAGDAGNLECVAVALRAKHPAATIIVCADDDWLTRVNGKLRNVGKTAGQKAARAVGGALAVPWFGPARPRWATDFNDMARLSGLEDVADGIRLALVSHEERQHAGEPPAAASSPQGVGLDDFYAYMPMHSYLYRPTREMWPAASVNAKIAPIACVDEYGEPERNAKGKEKTTPAATWLDAHRSIEQMTWAPGEAELIKDRYVAEGGWVEHPGARIYNLYRSPTAVCGDASKAGRWCDHLRLVFGDDADHIELFLAHRVQRPGEKINHALVLGGGQGIGKDTILVPVKYAVGPWNFQEIGPQQLLGRFNGFIKSVVLRVSEARDLGDIDRYALYERLKVYTAAPPEGLRVDEKNLREHTVLNCTGVVMTTNHKTDGIYLPADDRRHFVAWSDLTREEFEKEYWKEIYAWYAEGGIGHVAAYLASLDLSGFDPKAPPPQTDAFWAIVTANHAPEDSELADTLDRLRNPDATTLLRVADQADGDFGMWLRDRKNRRVVGYRFEGCGYVAVRNKHAKDGLWVLGERRQVVYAKSSLSVRDRYVAVQKFAGEPAGEE
jgi:phage/plasmid primase-like uncharacterized protein